MIIDRIVEIIKNQGIAVSKFERTIGASEGTIRNAIKKNNEINSKWIGIISEKYPEINTAWLITGMGEMLLKGENRVSEDETEYKLSNKVGEEFEKLPIEKKLMAIFKTQEVILRNQELQKEALTMLLPNK